MSDFPVYQGYASQYGRGLGNVLGGIVRAALPIVKTVAKKAGSHLLESGINYIQRKVNPAKRTTLPPTVIPIKRRKPPGKPAVRRSLLKIKRPVRRSNRKTKPRDIFTA